MEDLTKQQMVLLTLLVSFVASIATSVSVVSLLNETPTTITQTVNRIVEKTIEKVVPAQVAQMLPTPTTPPQKEIPQVSESDSITRAVEMNLSKMLIIREGETARGIGFAASGDSLVVTDKNILGEDIEYSATFPDGKTYQAKRVYAGKDSGIAILELRDEKNQIATSTPYISFAPNEPKLGSSIIALGGKEGATVYQGIVSEKTKSHFITNIPFKQADRGGILFDIGGKVLGMNVIGTDEEKYTVPAADILTALESYRKEMAVKAP